MPRRWGNAHPNLTPYQAFPTADGNLILAIGNDGQFRRCCQVAGLPDVPGDPRFVDNRSRLANRPALVAIVADSRMRCLISLTEIDSSSVAAETDCTFAEACSEAPATLAERSWVDSAVRINIAAEVSSAVADDETLVTLAPTASAPSTSGHDKAGAGIRRPARIPRAWRRTAAPARFRPGCVHPRFAG